MSGYHVYDFPTRTLEVCPFCEADILYYNDDEPPSYECENGCTWQDPPCSDDEVEETG